MKPKPNKNLAYLGLHNERKRVENIKFSCQEKTYELNFLPMLITISFTGFLFPGVMYQFFDLADRAVVNDA